MEIECPSGMVVLGGGRAGRNKEEGEETREGEVKTAVITSSSMMGLAQHDGADSR